MSPRHSPVGIHRTCTRRRWTYSRTLKAEASTCVVLLRWRPGSIGPSLAAPYPPCTAIRQAQLPTVPSSAEALADGPSVGARPQANYVHSHAGYRPSPLFPHSGLMYEKRGCISKHCRYDLSSSGEAPVDSTAHVILDCPAHAEARKDLLRCVDAALMRCGLTREDDVGTPQRLVCLLLGSPPANVSARLIVDPTAYRDILRATAHFIRAVYTTRWCAQ